MSKINISKPYDDSVIIRHSLTKTTWFYPHVHPDQVELWYINEGPAVCWCDEKPYTCKKGDFFIVFPNQTHKYTELIPEVTEHTVIQVKSKSLGYIGKTTNDFIPTNPLWHCDDETIETLLNYILSEYENGTPTRTIETLLTAFFDKLLRNYNLQPIPRGKTKVIDVLAFCEEHFTEELSLEIIAKELFVSRGYVSYIFNNRLNTTFTDFINNLRVDKVLSEVQNNNLPLNDAIFAAGFNSQRTFNRAFQKIYNTTPSKYLSGR